jgi:DNA invertase Pin-like site-specific DNA recombinase
LKKAVPYYRVSTERQGHSRLGLEAQQKSVHDFALSNNFKLMGEYTEIESGKKSKRPVLLQAIEKCKREKAILLIAKLDRLGRNVAFISHLMESDVDFKAVDNPYANKFIVHIMAAVAEFERDLISTRTKEALQAAKKRGTQLGSFGKEVLSKRNKKASEKFAKKIKPLIKVLRKDGYDTVRALRDILNNTNVPTFRGNKSKWHLNTVHRLLKQIDQ